MENWISQQADFYPTVLSSASVSFQTGLLCPPPRYVLCCWMPHLLIHSEVRLGIGDDFPVPLMKIFHFVSHIQKIYPACLFPFSRKRQSGMMFILKIVETRLLFKEK